MSFKEMMLKNFLVMEFCTIWISSMAYSADTEQDYLGR